MTTEKLSPAEVLRRAFDQEAVAQLLAAFAQIAEAATRIATVLERVAIPAPEPEFTEQHGNPRLAGVADGLGLAFRRGTGL